MTESHDPARYRLAWLDYAKEIGIVLVVVGHANRSIVGSGMEWSGFLEMVDRLIYSFHMPLFFLIGGLTSTLSRRRDWSGFLIGTWWGVAFPYLLGSLFWVLAKVAFPGVANTSVSLDALSNMLFVPIEHFWFLHHLLVARLFWFLIDPQASFRRTLLVLVSLLSAAIFWNGGVLTSLFYYGVGVVLLGALMKISGRSAGIIFGGAAVFWMIFVLLPAGLGGMLQQIATAILGSIAVISLARAMPEPTTIWFRALGFVGEASLVIYLLHLYFATLARIILKGAGSLTGNKLVTFASLLGLLGPLLVQVLLLRSSGRGWPISQWLGLGTLSRSSYFDFSSPKSGTTGTTL